MTFIGRKSELLILEERYASDQFELCVMYGRRRVGKTTLINEFTKDKRCIFFSAVQGSAQENIEFLSATILRETDSSLQGAVFSSLNDAFEKVFELGSEQRLIFVIDEYPYLVHSQATTSSLLQHLIDKHKDTSKLMIILNGSSMTQMNSEFFTNNRPLYGRKTFQIKVQPFKFFEMREYFDKTKPELLPYIYGVYGGIPKYFEGYAQNKTLRENITRDFLSIGALLLEEPDAVLKQDVREPASYSTLFAAIANGASKYSELSSKANLESGNVSRYLNNLVFLDLVRREVPSYTEERRKVLYRVDDNMFSFWYRFVPRSLSLINSNHPQIAYEYIDKNLDQYMGGIFEQICMEYLWRINGSSALPFSFSQAGRWWGSDPKLKQDAEIDIIAHDGSSKGLFCECKWSTSKVGEDILLELSERAKLPQFAKLSEKQLCLFSRSGFTAGCLKQAQSSGNVLLFSLGTILNSQ
ncbi:ATPase [Actinomycetota bacterium]|nr:ATPase [Actinomycetota bacterium]